MRINPTPVNDPKLRDVMANFGTHKIMVCQNHPQSQFSSKNPHQRSIFVLTTDCKCPVSDLLVIDDGRTAEEMIVEDVIALIITDAVSEMVNDGNMVVTDVKVPDYADIMRLENMVWNATALRTDYQEYAKFYHQLATEYTEDVLILCIEQYNTGRKW